MKYDSSKDTLIHKKNIDMVFRVLLDELAKRNETHDDSKLVPPEKPSFGFVRSCVTTRILSWVFSIIY